MKRISISHSVCKGGKVTSAGWQVTLCDLIWHVISRSGVVISITNCYIRLTLLTCLLTYFVGKRLDASVGDRAIAEIHFTWNSRWL